MAAVFNRLSGAASTLSEFGGSAQWGSSDATLSIDGNSELRTSGAFRQLLVVPNSSSCSLYLESYDLLPTDDLYPTVITFGLKLAQGGTVTITLYDDGDGTESPVTKEIQVNKTVDQPNINGVGNPSWRIYRSDPIFLPKGSLSAPRIGVLIEIQPSSLDSEIIFTSPVVCGKNDSARYSEALRQIMENMPEFMLETSAFETNPDFALQRFIDVAFEGLDRAVQAAFDYRYSDIEGGKIESDPNTLSKLVAPSVAEVEELLWLVQFTGTEPVKKLDSSVDPSDPFVLDESVLNSGDTLRFSTSQLLDPPTNTVDVQRTFLDWQASTGYYGINAGTVKAIREAVKRVMIEPKEVTITLQHEGPFTMLVQTPWAQTYGGASDLVGGGSPIVSEAIHYAKPLGVKVEHQFI